MFAADIRRHRMFTMADTASPATYPCRVFTSHLDGAAYYETMLSVTWAPPIMTKASFVQSLAMSMRASVFAFLFALLGVLASAPLASPAYATDSTPDDQEQTDAIRQVRALLAKGGRLESDGKFAEAVKSYERAVEYSREALGPQHSESIKSLNSYGLALFKRGRADKAEPILAEAMRLSSDVLGEKHPFTSVVYLNYGVVLRDQGRLDEAEPFIRMAHNIDREVLSYFHPNTLTSTNTYGLLLTDLGKLTRAEYVLRYALPMSRAMTGPKSSQTIQSILNYAGVLQRLGRYSEAGERLLEAIELNREIRGENHPETVKSLNNYATLLLESGRASEAVPILKKALRTALESLGERDPVTLLVLQNSANALDKTGSLNRATRFAAQALRLSRSALGDEHPQTLASLGNYGGYLRRSGRTEEAADVARQTLASSRRVFGDEHPGTILAMHNYASLLGETGRLDKARTLSKEILDLAPQVLGERHPKTLLYRSDFVFYAMLAGDAGRALSEARNLTAFTRNSSGLQHADPRETERLLRQSDSIGQEAEMLLADSLWLTAAEKPEHLERIEAEAFAALQRASSGAASRAVSRSAAARLAGGEGLGQLVREREGLIARWLDLEAAIVASQSSGPEADARRGVLRSSLENVDVRLDQIDAELRERVPEYFAILRPGSIQLGDLRDFLGEDEAVLLLVPTSFGTHALSISQDGIAWNRAKRDTKDIDREVSALRTGLEVDGSGALPIFEPERAHALYNALIEPVERVLEGKRRVYVVADGALSRIPLGTLVTSEPEQGINPNAPEALRGLDWLADRYALVQLPSVQSLWFIRRFHPKDNDTRNVNFRGFGAPSLSDEARLRGVRSASIAPKDADDFIGQIRDLGESPLMEPAALRQLSSLPGTESELEQVRIAMEAGQDAVFLGERMTESAIRETDLADVDILHFATHGFTSDDAKSVAEPGLIFTPPARATLADDGYLSASEVVELDLSSAQWVILSACNTAAPATGSGKSGMSGLVKAFFYAGTESLLVSHWPVFDDIAPILTVETLKLSQTGMSRAEAFQAAMQKVRNDPQPDAAHPAVWAPFTIVGEGR